MTIGKQNKLLAVGASLLLHAAAAAILIFGVSGSALISRDADNPGFVWASLSAKDKNSSAAVRKSGSQKTQSAATRTSQPPAISVSRNFRVGAETTAQESEAAEYDKTISFAGNQAVTYAAAGGHVPLSDAGRQTVASGMVQAFSSAYPLYRENPPPGYPEIARRQGYEGVVLVAAEILVDGRVGKAVISKSSGYAILDQTAMKAVMAWKFEPAKRSGIPYKTWAELPIKFVINDSNTQS